MLLLLPLLLPHHLLLLLPHLLVAAPLNQEQVADTLNKLDLGEVVSEAHSYLHLLKEGHMAQDRYSRKTVGFRPGPTRKMNRDLFFGQGRILVGRSREEDGSLPVYQYGSQHNLHGTGTATATVVCSQ